LALTETVIYSYAGYENCQGQLLRDLDALDGEVDIASGRDAKRTRRKAGIIGKTMNMAGM